MCPVPSSCDTVKAAWRPLSSMTEQLLLGSHMVPTSATPRVSQCWCPQISWRGKKRDRVDKGFRKKMDRLRQQPEERKEPCWRREERRDRFQTLISRHRSISSRQTFSPPSRLLPAKHICQCFHRKMKQIHWQTKKSEGGYLTVWSLVCCTRPKPESISNVCHPWVEQPHPWKRATQKRFLFSFWKNSDSFASARHLAHATETNMNSVVFSHRLSGQTSALSSAILRVTFCTWQK